MNQKSRRNIQKLQRTPFVTYGLLALTIIMFLLMTVNGGSQNIFTLVYFGAKSNPAIVAGEWWRLITPMFLHIGFTHILFNGLIVYFLGSQLEMILGHFRYFLLYILSGILGNAASFAFNFSISAGASTAVFGLFASTIVLGKLYPNQTGIQQLSRNYIALIIINILFGLFNSSIDNAGHIGGLVGGYLVMYLLSAPNVRNNPTKQRIMYGGLFILILLLLIGIGYFRTIRMFY